MTTESDITCALKNTLGGEQWRKQHTIQRLWSGYGEIARFIAQNGKSVVIKHVRPPDAPDHPRGWSGQMGHRRKLRSYQVEAHFYQTLARNRNAAWRVPELLLCIPHHPTPILVMEDLDQVGFTERANQASDNQIFTVLEWLAAFHAQHLGIRDKQLWEIGTYWHLETRPEEFEVMPPGQLKDAALTIDELLNHAQFQTLVHGDAKLANYCFDLTGSAVAAVDFQYTGSGIGVKDVAYFLGSCLDEEGLLRSADVCLDHYFNALRNQLAVHGKKDLAAAVEAEWCRLYPFVWADFHRFLLGWNPTHFKINRYMQAMTHKALSLV